jgi:hypothetical protein
MVWARLPRSPCLPSPVSLISPNLRDTGKDAERYFLEDKDRLKPSVLLIFHCRFAYVP